MDDADFILWMGWTSDWKSLRSHGWTITKKKGYANWRATEKSYDKIYLRHPELRMLGRITLKPKELNPAWAWALAETTVWELDFLCNERNARVKPHPIFIHKDLTEADIDNLYEIILDLQSTRPKRKREPEELPQAEILAIRA